MKLWQSLGKNRPTKNRKKTQAEDKDMGLFGEVKKGRSN